MLSLEERFWRWVAKGLHDADCWIWLGASDKDGYGVFTIGTAKGTSRAHRMAWELTKGPIPKGLQVLHTCDQPACVRPDHLWLGTHLQNHQDKARKGRSTLGRKKPADSIKYGDESYNHRLSSTAVQDIRKNYVPRKTPLRFFADKYGVSISTIHWVVSGSTWKESSGGC